MYNVYMYELIKLLKMYVRTYNNNITNYKKWLTASRNFLIIKIIFLTH